MKTTNTISTLTLATASIFFVACGGGSSTSPATGVSTSKITGTVPGTLIEAFCDDGSYAKVSSVKNGTDKHPFEIIVPNNTQCKLLMTTNENDANNRVITPIGFVKTSSTGTTLKLNDDIDLGNIPLSLNYADVADGNNDHVVDSPLNVNLNNTAPAEVSDTKVRSYDKDDDGHIDVYQDKDNNGVVDAYDDDNQDGIANIDEDKNNDRRPDYLEDDDKDGVLNYRDDDDNNGRADYTDDDDNDGIENYVDNDDRNGNDNDNDNDRDGNDDDDRR